MKLEAMTNFIHHCQQIAAELGVPLLDYNEMDIGFLERPREEKTNFMAPALSRLPTWARD